MLIPEDARVCPYCRKNQGLTFGKILLLLILIPVVIVLIGIVSAVVVPRDNTKKTPAQSTRTTQPIVKTNSFNPLPGSISAKNLYDIYYANEVAADEKFKDKRITVYGVIESINKNIADQPYITLSAGTLSYINCRFDKNKINQLISLQKKTMITIEGTCSGKIITSIHLHDCIIK